MIRKNKGSMKESYSDIDYSNVWDAYDIAREYLGTDDLCEALAKAMGTDELERNLKYIFRVYDIPFGDDEKFDEGCHGKKSKKRKSKKNEDLSDDLICRTCSNFKVEQTDTGTWVVKADSKRFGKQAIVFEGSSRREALNWMYKHIQPSKESVRRSSKKRMNEMEFHKKLYKLIDAENDEVIDVFSTEDAAESYAREYIRKWATEEDPVAVDCYIIDDEDYTDVYPKELAEDEYIWTLDSRNGGLIGESVTKKIPYDLVSSFVILRDYVDVNDSCVTDEHRDLVDIADSIYNADISVSDMSKKYQDVYKKYGKAYFDKVLKDIRAIDSQIDRTNINDLVAEVNDKLSSF